jgi:hypothetical protein
MAFARSVKLELGKFPVDITYEKRAAFRVLVNYFYNYGAVNAGTNAAH